MVLDLLGQFSSSGPEGTTFDHQPPLECGFFMLREERPFFFGLVVRSACPFEGPHRALPNPRRIQHYQRDTPRFWRAAMMSRAFPFPVLSLCQSINNVRMFSIAFGTMTDARKLVDFRVSL